MRWCELPLNSIKLVNMFTSNQLDSFLTFRMAMVRLWIDGEGVKHRKGIDLEGNDLCSILRVLSGIFLAYTFSYLSIYTRRLSLGDLHFWFAVKVFLSWVRSETKITHSLWTPWSSIWLGLHSVYEKWNLMRFHMKVRCISFSWEVGWS